MNLNTSGFPDAGNVPQTRQDNRNTSIASQLRRIDLATVRLFVAVCEGGSLTRAAAEYGIAISAASKRLRQLEQTLNIDLFLRRSTGMTLTSAGEVLFRHTHSMLRGLEHVVSDLRDYSEGLRGHVRILANLSAILEFLPEDLRSFYRIHGRIRVDLQERPSKEVIRGIEDEAGIGVGVVPDGAFQIFAARDLRSVTLLDGWASRQLRIVSRGRASLSLPAKSLLDHLTMVEEGEGAASGGHE
jgi:DNA-binding transcriptional LysR family regulator